LRTPKPKFDVLLKVVGYAGLEFATELEDSQTGVLLRIKIKVVGDAGLEFTTELEDTQTEV
jgi:Fe-S cluster assembly iron-binding protein IscA